MGWAILSNAKGHGTMFNKHQTATMTGHQQKNETTKKSFTQQVTSSLNFNRIHHQLTPNCFFSNVSNVGRQVHLRSHTT